MTTNLLTTGGVDFDNCFEAGSGTQLLYIYTPDGTDIGKKYYPASAGSKYGTTGMLAPSGTDVGNLLCKKGTKDDGSVRITSVGSKYLYYAKYDDYFFNRGWVKGSYGAINRIPYWGSKSTYLKGVVNEQVGQSYMHVYFSANVSISSIKMVTPKRTYTGSCSGMTANLGNDTYGSDIYAPWVLYFSPAPTGYL